ncbi:hypothetical protein [Bacillus cereus group sp. BfR-BA-01383]|uniref:hypothetical protein n=1 Tax=Bacillus cereus group sp. BfR-BA-01383 TaxID=2920327 RepID=UPI001F56AAF6|nr:hypothetical protein [Bacillus cereus group sp. BfR-BA-01383]
MVKCIEEYVQKDEPHYIIDAVKWIIGVEERLVCTLYFNIIGKRKRSDSSERFLA